MTICSGIDLVLDLTDFDEHVKQADLVITGEGRIDFQSALGKVPVGVAERAKKVRNVPVVAIAGAKGDGCETLYDFGIDADLRHGSGRHVVGGCDESCGGESAEYCRECA